MSDIITTATAGVDMTSDADLLKSENLAYGRNISLRGGRIRTRPKIKKVMGLPPGTFQGMKYFDTKSRRTLVMSICGAVYEVDPLTNKVVSILSSVDPTALLYGQNNPRRSRVWFERTPSGLVMQDGIAYALVYDGQKAYRSGGDSGIPVGTAMKFSNGRLAVAIQKKVRIGNIYAGTPGSEYTFTEAYSLDGGGDFNFPSEIRALHNVPVLDSSSGHGPLVVGTEESTFTLRTDVTTRSSWASTPKFQATLFPSSGICGQTAVAAVDQDLIYRATDGVRSLRLTSVNADNRVNLPLSEPIKERTRTDYPSWLQDASVVVFDRRLFATGGTAKHGVRTFFTCLNVMNLDVIQGEEGGSVASAWEGEWDGYRIYQIEKGIFDGRERCYFAGVDDNGNNALYEILPEYSEETSEEVFESEIETHALLGGSVSQKKALVGGNIVLSNLKGTAYLSVYYRSDTLQDWEPWTSFVLTAPTEETAAGKPLAQPRASLWLQEPPRRLTELNTTSNQGLKHQIKLRWSGDFKIEFIEVFTRLLDVKKYEQNFNEQGAVAIYAQRPRVYWYYPKDLLSFSCAETGTGFFNPLTDPLPGVGTATGVGTTGEQVEEIKQGVAGTALRTLRGKNIVLRVNPLGTWTSYVLVEYIPLGLSAVSITGGGVYDSTAHTITWTVSSNVSSLATFQYNVEGPDGEYTFDGILTAQP